MSLLARLTAIEQRQGPAGPYAVLIHVFADGTSVSVCYAGAPGHNDHMTLNEYRRAFPDGPGYIERWYVMGDSEEQPNQMSARSAARG